MPIKDRGFLQGDGCFETVRIHRGAPFRMDRHLRRLEESLHLLGLPSRLSGPELRDGARSLVQATHLEEGLLRITLTAPEAERPSAGTSLMTVRPLPDVPETVVLRISETCTRVPGPLSRCKTTSRALEAAALREAKQAGAFDAILLNPAGRLVETTARNLFLVRRDTLRTPPLSDGALPGITREAVLSLAPDLGLQLDEAPVPKEELSRADEVFLTGSGVGVLAVAEVGGFRSKSSPGPVTARLAQAYRALLDRESMW